MYISGAKSLNSFVTSARYKASNDSVSFGAINLKDVGGNIPSFS